MPGSIPAINSAPTLISVNIAQTIKSMLGGINMPRQADPATAPSANVCLYPSLRISGYAIRENAAAAAIDTPVTAANTVLPAMVAIASRPGRRFKVRSQMR